MLPQFLCGIVWPSAARPTSITVACELKPEAVYSDRPVITSKQIPNGEMTNRHSN
jgi:hypothetical protein